MSLQELQFHLFEQWHHTSPLEVVAVVFAVAQVLLAYRNSVFLYPAGLVSTGIYTWLFAQPAVGLYAEASLNLYYFGMSVYGWVLWLSKGRSGEELSISKSSRVDYQRAVLIFVFGFLLISFVLKKWTDSTVPFMDAFVSAAAWAGMWLLAKRKLENWLFLNCSNAVAIPLLFYKKMPLTALLTLFLLIVAIFGYLRWRRLLQTAVKASDERTANPR